MTATLSNINSSLQMTAIVTIPESGRILASEDNEWLMQRLRTGPLQSVANKSAGQPVLNRREGTGEIEVNQAHSTMVVGYQHPDFPTRSLGDATPAASVHGIS